MVVHLLESRRGFSLIDEQLEEKVEELDVIIGGEGVDGRDPWWSILWRV